MVVEAPQIDQHEQRVRITAKVHYVGRPTAVLQGLDETGRVIYVGTFSKVLFPALWKSEM